MNRKGWMHVVEAFFGVILIAGILFYQLRDTRTPPSPQESLSFTAKLILKEIADNQGFRGEIAGTSPAVGANSEVLLDGTVESGAIKNYITPRVPPGVQFKLYSCAIQNPCLLDPYQKNVVAEETYLDLRGVATATSSLKIKLYLWKS